MYLQTKKGKDTEPEWVKEQSKRKLAAETKISQEESEIDDLIREIYGRSSNQDGRCKKKKIFRGGNQIFFCSRTHSQLSQLVEQLRKTKHSVPVVSLASRKNLCLHSKIKNYQSINRINEECKHLVAGNNCPYYKPADPIFHAKLAMAPMDIEDLVRLGKSQGCCPYFAAREFVEEAQLVFLPYNLLLHKQSRAALSIDLKDSIVIIDEAHNLIDTLNEMHSPSIKKSQLLMSLDLFKKYQAKYAARLKGENYVNLSKLITVIERISQFKILSNEAQTINSFLFDCNIDNFNMLQLFEFISSFQIAFKVLQFSSEIKKDSSASVESCIFQASAFLLALTDSDCHSRLIIQPCSPSDVIYQFISMNPSIYFDLLLEECRSIVLAGGTMPPSKEFSILFPSIEMSRFNYPHVVSSSNLMAVAISNFNSGKFHFTLESRGDIHLMNSLFEFILLLVEATPGGVVVFFPSYAALTPALQALETSGYSAKISKFKKIFFEIQQEQNSKNTGIFSQYCSQIDLGLGAILFAVVGGKLSEGINFSDNYGRAVVMVGLPYPSPSSEMELKKSFYSKYGFSGQEFLDSIAMKAVNQSIGAALLNIGRVIRHSKDYAAIILLDDRYSSDRIQAGLPRWIQNSWLKEESFSFELIRSFFQKMASE